MNFLRRIFGSKKKQQQRGLYELAAIGGVNRDWVLQTMTDDADMWLNAYALTARVRDLFKTNPMYQSYRDSLIANVYGSEGIMLRMKVKEQEDRVIHTSDEKAAIRSWEKRRNDVFEFYAEKENREHKPVILMRELGTIGSRLSSVKVGQPDIYADIVIERAWKEWQRAENCDIRQTRNYAVLRQLRLIGAVRDGDFFIRMVRDVSVNKFGFTLQLIPAEYCDRFFNASLASGNVVRMGIEYQFNSWGVGKVVAVQHNPRAEHLGQRRPARPHRRSRHRSLLPPRGRR